MYNTHWLIIDIHESFLSLSILIIVQLSADNTVMDHAKEKNMEKLINNAPFALVLVFLVIGFVLLIKGADFFVEGSSSVAKRLHVPSIIIGLTIVAMGTSLPETRSVYRLPLQAIMSLRSVMSSVPISLI